jgi:hypothetical protein
MSGSWCSSALYSPLPGLFSRFIHSSSGSRTARGQSSPPTRSDLTSRRFTCSAFWYTYSEVTRATACGVGGPAAPRAALPMIRDAKILMASTKTGRYSLPAHILAVCHQPHCAPYSLIRVNLPLDPAHGERGAFVAVTRTPRGPFACVGGACRRGG